MVTQLLDVHDRIDPGPVALGRGRAGTLVASVGISLPERVLSSAELERRLELAPGWVLRRTGIRNRRIARPGERLQTHAVAAGREALTRAGVTPQAIDLVIVATSTADEVMPAAAPLVAHELGATEAGAFDLGAACTGFLSAVGVAAGLIESRRARAVLVVGADLMSRITDPDDRATAAVFADGAGAMLLRSTSGEGRVGPVILGADGAGADHIRVERSPAVIRMRGHETFQAAVARLADVTLEAVRAAGLDLEDVDRFVYHQANGRILRAVGERLGLAPARLLDCIEEYGNTGAATLPLALHHGERAGRLGPGDRVLLAAFGAGFTWGATVIEWGRPA